MDVWLETARRVETTHCDDRPDIGQVVDVLVIHNISLPPAKSEADFTQGLVESFFVGQLDTSLHPFFEEIAELRVSSHLYITRSGELVQFVPLNKRAWHAGLSEFNGRTRCNDFSIGIELQGADNIEYTNEQYHTLIQVTKQIQALFPMIKSDSIVGHEHISPGRKTDPGPSFDWQKYKSQL